MKKLGALIILVALIKLGSAQYSLTFCENVSDDGKPSKTSNSFMVAHGGSSLKFLLKADNKLNSDNMEFRIFYINDSGKEEEVSKLPQKVEPTWNYAWKEVVFFDPGIYRVKVYNSKGSYLTSANLSVKQ
jgi:hypothetical protein